MAVRVSDPENAGRKAECNEMPGSGTHVYFSVGAAPFRPVLAPATWRFEVAAGSESLPEDSTDYPSSYVRCSLAFRSWSRIALGWATGAYGLKECPVPGRHFTMASVSVWPISDLGGDRGRVCWTQEQGRLRWHDGCCARRRSFHSCKRGIACCYQRTDRALEGPLEPRRHCAMTK